MEFLADWERWAAELLESHMSYPLLGYFRSQHHNQSWLAALVTMLDTCGWLIVGAENAPERQARLTFEMCRHAMVDLALTFHTSPDKKRSAAFRTKIGLDCRASFRRPACRCAMIPMCAAGSMCSFSSMSDSSTRSRSDLKTKLRDASRKVRCSRIGPKARGAGCLKKRSKFFKPIRASMDEADGRQYLFLQGRLRPAPRPVPCRCDPSNEDRPRALL